MSRSTQAVNFCILLSAAVFLCIFLTPYAIFPMTEAEIQQREVVDAVPYLSDSDRELMKQAEKGDIASMRKLGLRMAYNNPILVAKGHALLSKAADMGDMASRCLVLLIDRQLNIAGNLHEHEWNRWGERIKTLNAIKNAPNGNDPDLMNCAGCLESMDKNEKSAANIWSKAAEAGSGFAKANLGFAYIYGKGVAKDREKGLRLVEEAANDTEEPSILKTFGVELVNKDGKKTVGPDAMAKAIDVLRKSAKAGNASAKINIYLLWKRDGKNTDIDSDEAISELREAAEMELPIAMFEYGKLKLKGSMGVEKDADQGTRLIEMASRAGIRDAASMVSKFDKSGIYKKIIEQGKQAMTEKDLPAAYDYFMRACLYGHEASACRPAALMKWTGKGVFRDPEMARKLIGTGAVSDRASVYGAMMDEYDLQKSQNIDLSWLWNVNRAYSEHRNSKDTLAAAISASGLERMPVLDMIGRLMYCLAHYSEGAINLAELEKWLNSQRAVPTSDVPPDIVDKYHAWCKILIPYLKGRDHLYAMDGLIYNLQKGMKIETTFDNGRPHQSWDKLRPDQKIPVQLAKATNELYDAFEAHNIPARVWLSLIEEVYQPQMENVRKAGLAARHDCDWSAHKQKAD